jgi:hypothetical protein
MKLQVENGILSSSFQESRDKLEAQNNTLSQEKMRLEAKVKELEELLIAANEAKESNNALFEELELARDNIANFEAS